MPNQSSSSSVTRTIPLRSSQSSCTLRTSRPSSSSRKPPPPRKPPCREPISGSGRRRTKPSARQGRVLERWRYRPIRRATPWRSSHPSRMRNWFSIPASSPSRFETRSGTSSPSPTERSFRQAPTRSSSPPKTGPSPIKSTSRPWRDAVTRSKRSSGYWESPAMWIASP